MNCLVQTVKDIWSLAQGLGITAKYLCSPRHTVHYPRATVPEEAAVSFRGPIELVGSPKDPATPKCISCMLCVQACPSGCISVTRSKAPVLSAEEEQAFAEAEARGEKPKKPAAPKNPARWEYNFTYCSLCGCCVESCPVNSIRFSNDMYIAGTSRQDFHYNLLARLARKAAAVTPEMSQAASSSQKEDSE